MKAYVTKTIKEAAAKQVEDIKYTYQAAKRLKKEPSIEAGGDLVLHSVLALGDLKTVGGDVEKAMDTITKIPFLHGLHHVLHHVFHNLIVHLSGEAPVVSQLVDISKIVLKFAEMYKQHKQNRRLHYMKLCIDREEGQHDYPLRELYSFLQREGDAALIRMSIAQSLNILAGVAKTAVHLHGGGFSGASVIISVAAEAISEGLGLAVGVPNKFKIWWGGYRKIIANDIAFRKDKENDRVPLLLDDPQSEYNKKLSHAMRQLLSRDPVYAKNGMRYLKYCITNADDDLCGEFFQYQYVKFKPYIDQLADYVEDDFLPRTSRLAKREKAKSKERLAF